VAGIPLDDILGLKNWRISANLFYAFLPREGRTHQEETFSAGTKKIVWKKRMKGKKKNIRRSASYFLIPTHSSSPPRMKRLTC
jgi:hypothetical protein